MPNDIPLSLYIHLPWCEKKCPYCDFNSFERSDFFDEQLYLEALLADLDNEVKRCQQHRLNSIFFGGGTPSLFSADTIHKIISHAGQLFRFNNIEITMEANPGTFEQEKFNQFKQAGINRLSIGIQSFNDAHLKALGRIHDKQQAITAIKTAKKAGFQNINLDLMFGLPHQSVDQALNDITSAAEFNVQHISHYQLTIEENTYFHKHRPVLPDSDLIWEMQTECQNLLNDRHYHQYEISAYSKAGKHSRHNLNYWLFADYIGIGAGAHGKLTTITDPAKPDGKQIITRLWKYRQPRQYIKHALNGSAISGKQQLDQQDIVFEFLLNALRLKNGSDIHTFIKHTGLSFETLKHAVKRIDPALLFFDENKIVTTDKGFLFLNEILEDLL